MNKILVVLAIVAVYFTFSLAPITNVDAAPAQMNQMVIPFNIGSTDAASTTNSLVVRVPLSCKIATIYVTNEATIATSATDKVVVTLFKNGSSYGAIDNTTVPFTALTPVALTPTAVKLAAGDVLQFKVTKTASGKATTSMGISVALFNTSSF